MTLEGVEGSVTFGMTQICWLFVVCWNIKQWMHLNVGSFGSDVGSIRFGGSMASIKCKIVKTFRALEVEEKWCAKMLCNIIIVLVVIYIVWQK